MICERLRQARLINGATQQAVVDRLAGVGISLTKACLSKYERGGSIPNAAVLAKLAKVLGVRSEYFLKEPSVGIEWMAFRSHQAVSKTARARVQALAAEVVERQVWIQEKLYPDTGHKFPDPVKAQLPEEAEKAALGLRKRWELDDNPIESLTDALEGRGGIVVERGEGTDGFDGLCGRVNDRYPVVVVNREMPDDRRRFSMAHELGHLLMDCKDIPPKNEEKLANRFAGAFLVPAAVARRELGPKRRRISVEELKLLKVKHGLSMLGWVHRAYDLGIIEHGHCQSLYKLFGFRGWRRQEPVEYIGKEEPIRLKQMTLHALAEGIITPEKANQLCPGAVVDSEEEHEQCIPIHMSATELMKLPIKDRDKILAQGATLAMADYQGDQDLTAFDAYGDEMLDEPG